MLLLLINSLPVSLKQIGLAVSLLIGLELMLSGLRRGLVLRAILRQRLHWPAPIAVVMELLRLLWASRLLHHCQALVHVLARRHHLGMIWLLMLHLGVVLHHH